MRKNKCLSTKTIIASVSSAYRCSWPAVSRWIRTTSGRQPQCQNLAEPGGNAAANAVLTDWQHVLADKRLNKVVERALVSNRDLQESIADIEAARALYGEERASLFPTVDASLTHTRSRTASDGVSGLAGGRFGEQFRTRPLRAKCQPGARG